MKIAIISDLHGSLTALEQVLAQLAPWQPDHYLLLGDLLNHGPRNPVPAGYDPAAVAARLNQLAPRIMAVRGNCDSEGGVGLSATVISMSPATCPCLQGACSSAVIPMCLCYVRKER